MQKFILFLVASLFCYRLSAQQNPQYSQYMMNTYLINPAVVGIEDYTDIKVGYRNQWTNFEGAPTTYYLTAHFALDKPDRTSTVQRLILAKLFVVLLLLLANIAVSHEYQGIRV
jgi:type IX secretion system PorP/SprF family membrane protein